MKQVPVNSLDQALLKRIAADAAGHFGLPAPPVPARAWLMRNPYSVVICLDLTQAEWQRRVFAKLPRDAEPNRDYLQGLMKKEYDLLGQLAAPTTGSQVGTVEALAYYADVPSVVTIEAEGGTLRRAYSRQARLWSAAAQREDLVRRARLCGQWLAGFHARTEVGERPFDIDELLDYCRPRIETLMRLHPGVLSPQTQGALERAARQLAGPLGPGTGGTRICGRHNDFASHNIIACRDGGIRVLDFMAFDHGSAVFDVCNFWFELEQLKFDPTHAGTLLARMQESFLDAYGSVHATQPEFELARLRYSINRLLNELEHQRSSQALWPRLHRCVRGTRAWLEAFAALARA